MRPQFRHAALIVLALSIAFRAGAVTISVTSQDTPGCDTLSLPTDVDELGYSPAFPVGERLTTLPPTVQRKNACPETNIVSQTDAIVTIFNSQAVAYTDLWYVAEPETLISNADGLVNGLLAFKIDKLDANQPLDFENGVVDNIFSPGERWTFIIQDYVNTLGLPANAFTEVLIPSPVVVGKTSSGSIIGFPVIPVPEPGTAALLALGLLGLRRRRR